MRHTETMFLSQIKLLDMQSHFNHNFLSSYRYYPQHMQGSQFKFITRQYPFDKKRNGNFNSVF